MDWCGTVHLNNKGMPYIKTNMGWHLSQNQEILDSNGTEGQERCIRINMHQPPADGNFKNEPGNIAKLAIN
jgi:hypothetical protein